MENKTKRVVIHPTFGLCQVMAEFDLTCGDIQYIARPIIVDHLSRLLKMQGGDTVSVLKRGLMRAEAQHPEVKRLLEILEEEVSGIAWTKVEKQSSDVVLITGYLSVNGRLAALRVPFSLGWIEHVTLEPKSVGHHVVMAIVDTVSEAIVKGEPG